MAMDISRIKTVLRNAQYPSTWKIPDPDIPVNDFLKHQMEKLNSSDEESQFKYNRVIMSLLLAYEMCDKQADYSTSLQYLDYCGDHQNDLEREECQESLYAAVRTVLAHVTSATRAHVLLAAGSTTEALAEAAKIKPVNVKNKREMAGFLGLQAALQLYYGPTGHRLAVENAREAVELAPEEAEWHFIFGIALGRIRRIEYQTISKDEINAIEKAFALQRNASYVVHLATLYSEYSSEIYFTAKGEEREKAKVYASKAIARYKEALELRPNCVHLKSRVAHGLIRIRYADLVDIVYVKVLLEEVVEATPNSAMVHHDLGLYYHKYARNNDRAIASLKKSNELINIKALILLINVMWKSKLDNCIIPELKEALTKYSGEENIAEILTNLGACYWLKKNKEEALDCFKKLLEIPTAEKYWKKHIGFDGRRKTNIIQLVVDHLRVQEHGNKQVYEDFLDFVKKIRPELFEKPPVDALCAWEKKEFTAQKWMK